MAYLPPVAGSEAVEQVGIRAAVRRRARDTEQWYSAPYRASQLGCEVVPVDGVAWATGVQVLDMC
jgi:hypothetical protein